MKKLVDCASTGCRLPEDVATEVDALVKTLPTGCQYRTKAIQADAVQFEPGETRAEVSILTTSTTDKIGQVVLPSGIDLGAYRKSMVVLWAHDHDKPVASCKWIKQQGETLRAMTVYPPKPDDFQGDFFTDSVWAMTKSGVLRGKSIGFLPTKPLREPTPDELERRPDWAGSGIWDETLLLEYSCVSVGMNNDALVEAINTKCVCSTALKGLNIEVPQPAPRTLEELEAIVRKCKCRPKGKPKQKGGDVNKALSAALEQIDLDVDTIVENAVLQFRNRGKV